MDKAENDTVNVHALPDPTFVILPSKTGTLCLEDSILFKANLVDANVSYLWQPEHNFNNNNHAVKTTGTTTTLPSPFPLLPLFQHGVVFLYCYSA